MKDRIYKIFEIFGGILEFICPFLIGAELVERYLYRKGSITDFIIGAIIIVAFIIYRCEKLAKKE